MPWTKLAGSFISCRWEHESWRKIRPGGWFGSIFFCYLQSRCHQTSWYSHRNPWFPDSTTLLFHFGRSQGMQCRPCRASKMIGKLKEEPQIIPENLCILITGVFCVRWHTVPPLGYPSLEIRPLWRWGNLARPAQKAEEYLHQRTLFCVAFAQCITYIFTFLWSAFLLTFPHTMSLLMFLGHLMKTSAAAPLSKAG